jgi:hypothetical protein
MSFICDVMLGKLARYLRFLGFDTIYIRNRDALDYYRRNNSERFLLTRRKETLYKKSIHVKSDNAREQLKEIKGLIKPYIRSEALLSRCSRCNRELLDVNKTEIEPFVPEFVFHTYARFKTCPSCRRVYWEGSHTEGMAALLKEVTA